MTRHGDTVREEARDSYIKLRFWSKSQEGNKGHVQHDINLSEQERIRPNRLNLAHENNQRPMNFNETLKSPKSVSCPVIPPQL